MTKVHRFRSALAAGLAAGALGGAAHAAELRGSLQGVDGLQPSATPSTGNRRLSYWEEPNGAIDVRHTRVNPETDLAIVVTGATVDETHQPVHLPIAGGRCRPGTALVVPNGTLELQNQDWFAHEFFATAEDSPAPIANFAPEATAARSSRQVQIAQAGTYELHDRLQPQFRCWIVVGTGQGRLVTAGADNSFHVPNVVDGDYNLKVYFEGRVLSEANAHVANGHDATVPAINLAAAPAAGASGNNANGQPAGAPGAAAAAAAGNTAAPNRRRGRGR